RIPFSTTCWTSGRKAARMRCEFSGSRTRIHQSKTPGRSAEAAGSKRLSTDSGRLDITGPITEGRVLINAQMAAPLVAQFVQKNAIDGVVLEEMLVTAAGQAAMAKRHSRVEVATKLAQANDLARQGKLKSEIARTLGVSVMTLHRWRKEASQPDRASSGDD